MVAPTESCQSPDQPHKVEQSADILSERNAKPELHGRPNVPVRAKWHRAPLPEGLRMEDCDWLKNAVASMAVSTVERKIQGRRWRGTYNRDRCTADELLQLESLSRLPISCVGRDQFVTRSLEISQHAVLHHRVYFNRSEAARVAQQ